MTEPKRPSFKPKCPVCASTLEGVPFPLPEKGKGRCPSAGYYSFRAEVDNEKMVKDKNGNMEPVKGWKVKGIGKDLH